MNLEQKERLKTKIVDTQRYLIETEDKKKAMTQSLNDEIKAAKKRINAIVEALDSGDFSLLNSFFDNDEIKYFVGG